MGPIRTISEFFDLLKRRVWVIAFVTLVGAILSVVYAASVQHLYESTEVLQVQSAMVSGDVAPSVDSSSSARRLQLIEQQIMSRTELLDIIQALGLFVDRPDLTDNEKAQLLRQSVSLTGVAAARQGYADDGTVSVLRVTATMDSPEAAQAVAQEFSRRTVALSVNTRLERARETVEFLRRQSIAAQADVDAAEAAVARFRVENDMDSQGANASRQREIENINAQILVLEREILTAQQAVEQPTNRPQLSRVEQRQLDDARLRVESLTVQKELLENRAAALQSTIQSNPDLQRQLTALEVELENRQTTLADVQRRVAAAEQAYQIEERAQSERLAVIEPASLPDYPVTGSRKTMALMGLVASLIGGLIVAYLLDVLFPVVRSSRQMERELGLRPIVAIPEVDTKRRK